MGEGVWDRNETLFSSAFHYNRPEPAYESPMYPTLGGFSPPINRFGKLSSRCRLPAWPCYAELGSKTYAYICLNCEVLSVIR
jgi:hypothetical protein